VPAATFNFLVIFQCARSVGLANLGNREEQPQPPSKSCSHRRRLILLTRSTSFVACLFHRVRLLPLRHDFATLVSFRLMPIGKFPRTDLSLLFKGGFPWVSGWEVFQCVSFRGQFPSPEATYTEQLLKSSTAQIPYPCPPFVFQPTTCESD
jgi:hypothetical protein